MLTDPEEEPGLDMGATSKKLAELWKATTDEEKALYQVPLLTCRRILPLPSHVIE